ncbi:MAG: helix-turn-helix domain-containing protein [Candidatus Kapaibacterium sp.]|nr:helix-turn-helix domain-containing protein [Ignavibacteriota bacterium]MCB9222045.1 helix-turn-helix domain-containing protein [Ignavibacteria bacterium]
MQQTNNKLLTIPEICHNLNISTTTLWRLRKKGAIPFIKAGNTVLFDYNEVITALKKSSSLGGMK